MTKHTNVKSIEGRHGDRHGDARQLLYHEQLRVVGQRQSKSYTLMQSRNYNEKQPKQLQQRKTTTKNNNQKNTTTTTTDNK